MPDEQGKRQNQADCEASKDCVQNPRKVDEVIRTSAVELVESVNYTVGGTGKSHEWCESRIAFKNASRRFELIHRAT